MLRSIGKQSRGILWRRQRREKRDASTNEWNEFGVSRERFKPSTPGSTARTLPVKTLCVRWHSMTHRILRPSTKW